MKVGVFVVTAILGRQLELGKKMLAEAKELLKGIEDYVEFSGLITSVSSAKAEAERMKEKVVGGVVIVCTGGTDRMIESLITALGKPALIFTHPLYNSLASVREALAVLRWRGIDVGVVYGDFKELRTKIEPFVMALHTAHRLEGSRLGQVGVPEPWLLTVRDPELIKRRLGVTVVKIPWEELLEEAKKVEEAEVSRRVKELKSKFGKVAEPTDEDLGKAIRLYLGMKELVKRYGLHAMAVEARDMLDPSLIDWGPYLGVSLLSDDGIPADYEVDLDGVLTKLIIYYLTGKPSFMANVTRVDESKNTVVFSHCTIPTSMIDVKKSVIRSYYETNKSVAIRGRMLEGEVVTFARIGGVNMDKMMVGIGRIVNGDIGSEDLCRTQIEVKVEGRALDIVEKALGNHIVVVYGDIRPYLTAFCKVKGIEPVPV